MKHSQVHVIKWLLAERWEGFHCAAGEIEVRCVCRCRSVVFWTSTETRRPQQHLRCRQTERDGSHQSERRRQEAVAVLSVNRGATVTNKWAGGQWSRREPLYLESVFFFLLVLFSELQSVQLKVWSDRSVGRLAARYKTLMCKCRVYFVLTFLLLLLGRLCG